MQTARLTSCLKAIPHLSLISRIATARGVGLWLVGGFLRDACLGVKKALLDFDFCVERDTVAIAREFARRIHSKCIVLDEAQEAFRVIEPKASRPCRFDFSRMRAASLPEDLRLRDFTINTLAVDIRTQALPLVDCCGALRDLKRKLIRVPGPGVISDDPLRILRGFSLAATYGFTIAADTLRLMEKNRALLASVSGERIAEELFKLLSAPLSYKTIRLMDRLRIIDEVLPFIANCRGVTQGGFHHLDVWGHSQETLRQFELLCAKKLRHKRDISVYLGQEVSQGRSRAQIIKLACLLHDIGKPDAKKKLKKRTIFYEHEKIGSRMSGELCERLKLSGREKEMLQKLIFWHLRPGYLADQITPTTRALYHFFRDTQDEGAGVILLSLSDWRATRGPLTSTARRSRHEKIMLSLLRDHIREKKKKPLVPLVNGNDIMEKFNLSSGPLIGVILKKIREEQSLGAVTTKAAAFRLSRRIIACQRKYLEHPTHESKRTRSTHEIKRP